MKKYSILFLAMLTFFACRKGEKDKIEGPSLNNIFGPFAILTTLESSRDSVDFSNGETVYFTAEISKMVNWKLTITGLSSGAEKIIEGFSQTIDASGSVWDGSTTNLPLFKTEDCRVELTFEGQTDTLVDMVSVTGLKINEGFLISDFESGFNTGWTYFFQSGASMDFNIKTNSTAPQQNSYYNMQGEVNWDWLVGLVNFHSSAYGETTYPLNDNPDNVYFNVMIYGDSVLANSLVLFQFDEDDNEDGSYTGNEDRFAYEITVDWAGWKLVSISYSDMAALSTPAGNGVPEPHKLKDLNMLHLANPVSGLARSGLDYIIFTEGGPLNP